MRTKLLESRTPVARAASFLLRCVGSLNGQRARVGECVGLHTRRLLQVKISSRRKVPHVITILSYRQLSCIVPR